LGVIFIAPKIHLMRVFSLSIFLIAIFVVSCSPTKTDEQASADTLQTAPDTMAMPQDPEVSDDGEPIVGEQQEEPIKPSAILEAIAIDESDNDPVYEDSLSKYFTPEQIIILKKAKKQFKYIKTVQQMADYYPSTLVTVTEIVNKQIHEITPTEYSGDDSPDTSWKWFGDYYPGFFGSVDCSECDYDLKTTFEPLLGKAKETEALEDDMFLELAGVVYGGSASLTSSITNSQGWYELVGCDFCAASLLGNGKRLEIVGRIEQAASARPYFGKQMDEFQEAATSESFDKFFGIKKDILYELNMMLKNKILTPEQKTRLDDLRQKVVKGEVEVECGSKACNWPEY
jgi:hypothetical protein